MKRSCVLSAQNLLHDVRRAADLKPLVRQLPIAQRNAFLRALVAQAEGDIDNILDANRLDCELFVRQRGGSEKYSLRPNFALTRSWLDRILEGIERLTDQPDPIGFQKTLTNTHAAVKIDEHRVPLGMVAVVSRLRPRILLDGVAMAIKSGNVVLVDNGSSVHHTTRAISESIVRALTSVDIPTQVVVHMDEVAPDERPIGLSSSVHTTSVGASSTSQWLRMNDFIDVAVVCGSNRLHEYVAKNTTIPIIRATGHVCSLYIHQDADFDVAMEVIKNAKFQRLNATNAINNLLIDASFDRVADFLDQLVQSGVCVVGDAEVTRLFPAAGLASEEDWIGVQNGFSNFHKLCVKLLKRGVDEAVGFLSTYGSSQSDGIISTNPKAIEDFINKVDSAIVYINASTRFSSGECFGLGSDLAISTSRLHCRGPVSLESLTTKKFVVRAADNVKAVRPA